MCVVISDSELMKLSEEFFKDYPYEKYPELLRKTDRTFDVIVFEGHGDYFICIPFRSDMNEKNGAFFFKNTNRSKRGNSGVDFEKMVIIKDFKYLNNKSPILLDRDEYERFSYFKSQIHEKAFDYLQTYMDYIKKNSSMLSRKFKRDYQFTTLKYFHKELGLE